MKSVFVKKFGAAFVLAAFAMLTLHAQANPSGPPPPAVPEPSTIISGALLLIPLGAGMLRAYYKNRGK
jgi:hypothetical protein